MDELASKIAVRLLPPLTSPLPEKLQAAMQSAVDRFDKLVQFVSKNQSSATQSRTKPQLHSVMAKLLQMDRNVVDEKNKQEVFIGILHATTEDATKQEDEQMLREAITACESRQLSDSYAKGRITTKRRPDYQPGPKGSRLLKVTFESQAHCDIFLSSLKRKRVYKMQSLPHAYVRRDYNIVELII
ncbi:hypothetical protein Tcan_14892 [Toxocara canis]|uniref:Uncharacterized protein n=1 Tax=Toxocara canis TaxID=6265 RepID=A0A0B2V669_TOXCA|nr:hypothetical protein Tcan_14892 [Toxocara canis]